ncbi:hypothetical protein BDV09DRAFT_197936 [Aspergillus tetrazonus]
MTAQAATLLAEKVWYFGFGSNLKTSVMRSRGIEPLAAKPVRVPGYVLTFDVFGLPYSEPAMASISRYVVNASKDSGVDTDPPMVHGVAYLLSRADLVRLIGTEGGGVAYREAIVEGFPIRTGSGSINEEECMKPISMTTLVARYPRRPNAAPSARYLKIIKEGAEEHGLPDEYCGYLGSLPCFVPDKTWLHWLGAVIFLCVGRRAVWILARIVRRAVSRNNGMCPAWYGFLILYAYTAMWLWHDYIHAPMFGRGDGGHVRYGRLMLLTE